jgi:peroxiredoxin (alkyl hydroperoxide reductase subunit C)
MVRVGLAAPHFDGTAVVAGRLVRLSWQQLHEDKTLVLLFDPVSGPAHFPEYLVAVSNAVVRLGQPDARVAIVWSASPQETLAWTNRSRAVGGGGVLAFPLIADPESRIASLYELRPPGATALWGRFLIDPAGIIREMAVSDFPVWAGVDELLRIIHAVGSAAPAEP